MRIRLKAGGQTVYVGIAENFRNRQLQHLGATGLQIQPIPSLANITRRQARAIEQVVIFKYKLGKNGGSLVNKINSIAPKNLRGFQKELQWAMGWLKQNGLP